MSSYNQIMPKSYLEENFSLFFSYVKIPNWVITNKELCKYLYETEQPSIDLSSDNEEFIVTTDNLLDNNFTNIPSHSKGRMITQKQNNILI